MPQTSVPKLALRRANPRVLLEPSYEEAEADPMFMAEVAAQKAPDGYETMDVNFVPASESPMVQAD